MKTIGKFVLFIAALAGLYALPAINADACPEREEGWTCVERVASDEEASGDLAEISRTGDDDEEKATDDAVSERNTLYDISRGELIIGADEWPHDLLTSTKWNYDLIEVSVDEDLFVVTYSAEEVSTSTPRVMRPSSSRIQVLDADREEVVLDVELPDEIDGVEWTFDNELVVIDPDGALTVFAKP